MPFKPEEWKQKGTPIIRIQNLTEESCKFNYYDRPVSPIYEVNNGDILVSWSATLGVFKWNRGKAILNQHIFKAIPSAGIDHGFFYYAISKQIEQMKSMIHGTTMKHITRQPFLDTSIPLPPVDQQQKIASILSIVDELILKTIEIIEQTQRLKKGLMQKLFTKGIGHTRFKESAIGQIPESWNIVNIQEISHRIMKGIFDLNPKLYVPTGIPFLRISDIIDNSIDLSTTKYITDKTNSDFPSSELRSGDILLAKVGASAGSIEKIAKIPKSIDKCNISQNLIGIRLDQNRVIPDFLFSFLQLQNVMDTIISNSNTTTFKSIQLDVLRRFQIPLPIKEEQQKIVTILNSISTTIQQEVSFRNYLRKLKVGLMQKLLTGKIRVKVRILTSMHQLEAGQYLYITMKMPRNNCKII